VTKPKSKAKAKPLLSGARLRGKKRPRGWATKQAQEPAMIPEALKRIRTSLNLTQEQFAEELGVRPLTIGLWESGKTPISKSRALAIQGLAAKLTMGGNTSA
jgi:DNA-binding transcriptional regulator YiaG